MIVSFEQANGLAEIGFPQDLKTFGFYNENAKMIGGDYVFWKHSKKIDMFRIAPDLTYVQQWLFEQHGLFIKIDTLQEHFGTFYWSISERFENSEECHEISTNFPYINTTRKGDTYMNTLSWAISEAIKILKQRK